MSQVATPRRVVHGSGYDVAAGTFTQPLRADRYVLVLGLAPLEDPATGDDHVLSYDVGKTERGGRPVNVVVELRQGYADEARPGTLIASFEHRDVAAGTQPVAQPVSPDAARRITDYADLYLRFVFTRG